MFIALLTLYSQKSETTPKCPAANERLNKRVGPCNDCYSAIKRNEVLIYSMVEP